MLPAPPPRSPPPCFCRQGYPTAVLRPRFNPRARQGSCWQGQRASSLQTMLLRGCVRFLCETWKCSVTLKCIRSRKRWLEWILQRDLIPISNFVSICVVVFVFEIKINVIGHLVHIVVLSKLASPVEPSTAQYCPVQPNTAQCCPFQPSTASSSPVQPSKTQYSLAKYSPVQYSTAHYSPL